MNEFLHRAISGVILVVVVLGATLLSQYSYIALMYLLMVGSLVEFYRLSRHCDRNPLVWYGVGVSTLIFLIALAYFSTGLMLNWLLLPVIVLLLSPMFVELYRNNRRPISEIGVMMMSFIYIAFPFSLMLYFPTVTKWSWIVVGFILIVWANDVFAYLVGVKFGKHRLFERISPKKSWEGFFAGVVGSFLVALLVGHVLNHNIWIWGVMGVVVSLAAVIGDLVESMIKRSAGIKDSGSVIPGHGGFLDRFDALIFAAPLFFIIFIIFEKSL